MSVDAALQTLRDYCRSMPPVAAMQVGVAGYDGERLRFAAPLSANVNDKGCAFGGSLNSLLTVTGWGLLTLRLQLAGVEAEVYVADSTVRYLAPLYSDLQAEAAFAPGESWETFLATLKQRGRARIQVEAQVPLPEGGVATALTGRFVAIVRR